MSRGKRSIALDVKVARGVAQSVLRNAHGSLAPFSLQSETGLAAVKRLVAKADVVVDPFRPMVMERLGLSPEVLCGVSDLHFR